MIYPKNSNIAGIGLSCLNTKEYMDLITGHAESGSSVLTSFYINADCVNLYFKDADYAGIIDNGDIVYADGQPIVWFSRLFGEPLPERINAGDFFIEFCKVCAQKKLRLFLLGSKDNRSAISAEVIKKEVPDLIVTGAISGYIPPDKNNKVVESIAMSNTDILIVGMGAPVQENWIEANKAALNVKVCWGVGALFDYFSGNVPRAPVWMRTAGLEWLFRLAIEPKRLFKRYIIGNTLFLIKVFTKAIFKKEKF